MSPLGACWRFIGPVYAAPGVQESCLRLQRERDADIVLLLFAGWLASQGIALSSDEAAEAAACVRPWREQAVLPLRQVRTALKTSPAMVRPEVAALRERIKAEELAAERIELGMLVEWGERLVRSNARPEEGLFAGNLAACLPAGAGPAAAVADGALMTLVAACVEHSKTG